MGQMMIHLEVEVYDNAPASFLISKYTMGYLFEALQERTFQKRMLIW